MKCRPFAAIALAIASAAAVTHAQAQTQPWPAQPIKMIIPSTPGGGTDFIGRLLGTKLAEMNGWTIVPTNRPGAGTALGLAEGAKANPAGYDLVIGQTDNVSLIPLLLKVGYDPVKEFAAVTLVATTPYVMEVNASVGHRCPLATVTAAR